MKKVKLILTLLILLTLIFSIAYGYAPYKFRIRPIYPRILVRPEVSLIYVSEDIRKLIIERNKLWFELKELLLQKPLDLSKIEEKAKELQKLEEDIRARVETKFVENLSKKLALSKEQEENIKKIFQKYRDTLEALRKDLRKKALESNRKEVQEIQKKINETRKKLVDEIKEVLTDEQRSKFEKLFRGFYIDLPRVKIWIKR